MAKKKKAIKKPVVEKVVEQPVEQPVETVVPAEDIKVSDVCEHPNMTEKVSRPGGKAVLTEKKCPDCGFEDNSIFDEE